MTTPVSVNTMSRSSQISVDTSSDVVSIRNFVVDEDRANLGSALWKTVDKSAFVLAQREALEAFSLAKAIRLSEESAAVERKQRTSAGSASAVAGPSQPQSKEVEEEAVQPPAASSSAGPSRPPAPISIQRNDTGPAQVPSTSDEAAARSLARSWHVEGLQTTLLENRGQLPPSSSAATRPKTSSGPSSASSSSQSQSPSNVVHHHEKRPSVSKVSSSNVLLSTSSLSTAPASESLHPRVTTNPNPQYTHSSSVNVSSPHSQSQHSHSSVSRRSRSSSQSQYSHSRALSQSQVQQARVEQRPTLKRDPATVDGSPLSTSPPASRPHMTTRTSSASVAAATAAAESTQQKRQRTERKASVSVPASSSSQPQYSYSTSNYSSHYPYNTLNGGANNNQNNGNTQASSTQSQAQAQVIAPPMSETKKHASSSSSSSASSRDIQAGQILNPTNAGSSTSASAAASKESSPKVPVTILPSQGTSSASAQAAAAEREKERSRSNSRRRPSVSQAPTQVHQIFVPAEAQPQVTPQTQPQPQQQQQQQQGPRDIFAPVRFNCSKCGSMVASTVQAQPSLALTSPDPFSHPFASSLHVTCTNPACGAVHCRGCLQVVKCRDVDTPASDSWALVPSSFTSPSSPPRHTRSRESASRAHSCAGGPGCALWSCCKNVRAIAIWEALRAFDTVFAAEAGFQVPAANIDSRDYLQNQSLGRQHRELYVKLLISRPGKNTKRFEDAFLRTLKVVCSWLQPPSVADDTDYSDEGYQRREQEKEAYEMLLSQIFLSSLLLEVVHDFLSNNNVRDWISHSDTYLGILEMMSKVLDSGLGELLKEAPVQSPASSAASSSSSSAIYNPFAPTSVPSTQPVSLCDLVKQLEVHRGPLMAVASRVQFTATVGKINKLSEAISYLVLQQVVAF